MWKVRLPTIIGVGGKQMKPKQGFLAAVNLCILCSDSLRNDILSNRAV